MTDRQARILIPAKFVAYDIGMASTGREQIGLLFVAEDGRELVYYGTFTPDSFPITVRVLRELGWQGTKIRNLRAELKYGCDVQLVCEEEQWQGKAKLRIKFVNRRGVIRMDSAMTPEQRGGFATEVQQMLDAGLGDAAPGTRGGEAHAAPADDDDIPF
jgi:hypothetical protein